MRQALALALTLLVGLWALTLDGFAAETIPATTCCDARSCCTCPDDYCPKPLPCVPCAPLGNCDCYCRKPLLCPPCPLRYCGPNDYYSKPFCFWLPLCNPAWYSCGVPGYMPAVEDGDARVARPEPAAMGVVER